MDASDKKRIEEEIRRKEQLIRNASAGNPDIRRWEQEIKNLKSRLQF